VIIGVPKEVKKDEYRVGILPVGAHLLREDGHSILIQKEAGLGSGFSDQAYIDVGAEIVESPAECRFRRAPSQGYRI